MASIQLLEAIGALTKEESQKAQSRSTKTVYQETVTQVDTDDADKEAAAQQHEDFDESATLLAPGEGIASAVYKVFFLLQTSYKFIIIPVCI